MGAVEPGVHRPDGDAQGFGDLLKGQVHVVDEDQHRAVVDRQALEAPLQSLSFDVPPMRSGAVGSAIDRTIVVGCQRLRVRASM